MSRRTLTIVLVAFFILLSAGFMAYYFSITRGIPKQLPVIGEPGQHVDTFTFYDQQGRRITNRDVAGKVYVAEYFFATCEGMCPKMNDQMKRVFAAYNGNPEVMILSHTVNPEKDSSAALRRYAERFNAGSSKQWLFLTGDKQKLYNMARYSYLISAKDDTSGVSIDKDFIHDSKFLLVDRTGHIRGEYDGLKPAAVDTLISDVQVLLAEPVAR